MLTKIGLIVGYAPLEVGCEESPGILREAKEQLSRLPVEVITTDEPVFNLETAIKSADLFKQANVDVVCWLSSTWNHDTLLMDVIARVKAPMISWGMPNVNSGSICSAQQFMCVMKDIEHPGYFVFGNVDDQKVHQKIYDYAQTISVCENLKLKRVGMLGHRTVGMVEVAFHEQDARRVFGPSTIYKDIANYKNECKTIDKDLPEKKWQEYKTRVGQCNVTDDDGMVAMQSYFALKKWVHDDLLAGIAVGCYPDLMGEVCLGMGLLAEENIVTSCEGDMNSLILSYYMHHLSNSPVHNTDLLDLDATTRCAVCSHCGNSALSMAENKEDIVIDSVRLMGRGAASLYPAKPGQVTFANLCGNKSNYRLTYGVGQAREAEMVFPGIPVNLELPISVDKFFEQTAEFGTGHHWMIVYGDIGKQLATLGNYLNINKLEL